MIKFSPLFFFLCITINNNNLSARDVTLEREREGGSEHRFVTSKNGKERGELLVSYCFPLGF